MLQSFMLDSLYVLSSHTGLLIAASVHPGGTGAAHEETPAWFSCAACGFYALHVAGTFNSGAIHLAFKGGAMPATSIQFACGVHAILYIVSAVVIGGIQLSPTRRRRVRFWTVVRAATFAHSLHDIFLLACSMLFLLVHRDTSSADIDETVGVFLRMLLVGPAQLAIAVLLTPANRLRGSHMLLGDGRHEAATTRRRCAGGRRRAAKQAVEKMEDQRPPEGVQADDNRQEMMTQQATQQATPVTGGSVSTPRLEATLPAAAAAAAIVEDVRPPAGPSSPATRFRAADALATRYLSTRAVLLGPTTAALIVLGKSSRPLTQSSHVLTRPHACAPTMRLVHPENAWRVSHCGVCLTV